MSEKVNPEQDTIYKALIVDDEKSIRETLVGVLSDEGWISECAKNGREGLAKFLKYKPDFVLLDVWMAGWDGIETLQKMRAERTDTPIVIMSGHGNIETAVRATKLGAFDFLEKPLSLDKLLPMLDHAKEIKNAQPIGAEDSEGITPLVGKSPAIIQIGKQVDLVAPKNAWVLITGENGTGKEVIASLIHAKSSRAHNPFIAVNCAAIPDELIESELFGHTKGAFTNALSNKKGRFELADKGTLFLDEIGDMSLKTQAKILRILQEQSFERVGGSESIKVDVRVIAATNKDLKQAIADGEFREDLYYRINVVPFHMPPLRERGHDIVYLCDYFISKIAADLGEEPKVISSEVIDALKSHSWPGNVRELKNLLERLCIMVPGRDVSAADLANTFDLKPYEQRQGVDLAHATSLKEAKNEFEKTFIIEKLEENQWNISKTADAIGIERSNLHRKLKAFDIDPKQLKG